MSEDLYQNLDLKSQTALVKVLSSMIDDNEKLALANQEYSLNSSKVQSLSNQLAFQKNRLDALNQSNAKLEEEIENANRIYKEKMEEILPHYKKAIQTKTSLELQRDTKLKKLSNEVQELKLEEENLDKEIEKTKGLIQTLRNKFQILQTISNPSEIESNRLIEDAEELLHKYELQSRLYSDIVVYDSDLYSGSKSDSLDSQK